MTNLEIAARIVLTALEKADIAGDTLIWWEERELLWQALEPSVSPAQAPKLSERVKRLARNFAAEWLRPSDPDSADPALLDTLQTTMVAFFACASQLRAPSRATPEEEIERLRRIATEATNGWACYAKRKIEHDEIARLHRELSAASCATPEAADHPPLHADEHGDWAAANGVGARVHQLERALGNCYMMSKREIARMLNRNPMNVGVAADAITLERWQHVKRFCEESGQTSSILRAALPTEITEGAPSRATPEEEIERLRRIATEATNGWACYAKRKIEHDEIARLHRELSASRATSAPQEGPK